MEMIIESYRQASRARMTGIAFFAVFMIITLPAILLFVTGRTIPALLILTLPVLIGLLAHPRAALYLFLLSVSVYYPVRFEWLSVHPFDIAALILVASVALGYMVRGGTSMPATRLDMAFWFLISATILSGLLAYDKSLSVVPVLRICLVYLVFRSIYLIALDIGWRKLVIFYIGHVFVLSVINLTLFAMSGGLGREFGPAWLAYETYSMTACPMALVFLLLSRSWGARLLWAFVALTILAGIIVSLSRGPLVTVVLAIPAVLFVVNRVRARHTDSENRSFSWATALITSSLVVVALVVAASLLTTFSDRLEELGVSVTEPQGSIALRIILWKAALTAFLDNPVAGIGIGNFKQIAEIVPSLRLHEHWLRVSSMSAHNVFLQYLSETGIVGASALLFLAWRGIKLSLRTFARMVDDRLSAGAGALAVVMLIFGISVFYMRAWSWGQGGHIMALLFALTAAAATDSMTRQGLNKNER